MDISAGVRLQAIVHSPNTKVGESRTRMIFRLLHIALQEFEVGNILDRDPHVERHALLDLATIDPEDVVVSEGSEGAVGVADCTNMIWDPLVY